MQEPRASRFSATLPVATESVSAPTSASVRTGGAEMTAAPLYVTSKPMIM